MCLAPNDTTSEIPPNLGQELVEYEVAMTTQPLIDTVPCPPPDWEELE